MPRPNPFVIFREIKEKKIRSVFPELTLFSIKIDWEIARAVLQGKTPVNDDGGMLSLAFLGYVAEVLGVRDQDLRVFCSAEGFRIEVSNIDLSEFTNTSDCVDPC